jgi:predicted nuclease of predicted toxin-antitoxin system
MRLLVDMNLSPRWARQLRDARFSAEHWSQLGSPDAPDAAIMPFAKENGYVVLTHDLDFGAFLAATPCDKASAAQVRSEDLGPDGISEFVAAALRQMSAELEKGALLTTDPRRKRLRLRSLQSK